MPNGETAPHGASAPATISTKLIIVAKLVALTSKALAKGFSLPKPGTPPSLV